jgi:hypothetical protein
LSGRYRGVYDLDLRAHFGLEDIANQWKVGAPKMRVSIPRRAVRSASAPTLAPCAHGPTLDHRD